VIISFEYMKMTKIWLCVTMIVFVLLGEIQTIQLEYIDAKECLLQAAHKGPSSAIGFQI
jgi:hypothetical protein